MTKFFYVTGDSFAFGQELGDSLAKLFKFTQYQREHCYSGLICDRKNIPNYKNTACPGGSNERAYRLLLNDISTALKIYKPEEIFVNVSITDDSRREFCLTEQTNNNLNGGDFYIHLNSWEPIGTAAHFKDMWYILTKYFNHDIGHNTFGMMILLGMQNFLRINKVPYLFTSSMGNQYERAVQKNFISQTLVDQIYEKRYLRNTSFMHFNWDKHLPTGPGLHPLEEGHIQWANHLQNYIDDNNLWGNEDL